MILIQINGQVICAASNRETATSIVDFAQGIAALVDAPNASFDAVDIQRHADAGSFFGDAIAVGRVLAALKPSDNSGGAA